MPSRSFLENQPTTPSIKHHSVVVEPHDNDNATTSPLTSSLGGSPARTSGDRTPEYPLARAGVMSHYPPPHHQPQQHPQHPPQAAANAAATTAAGRDPRYVQMVSAGAPHFQGHVAYLPPNIPQLYQTPPGAGAGGPPHTYAAPPPGSYPPHAPPQQHHHPGATPAQHHQTYVIAGYPPPQAAAGHQHGHPPPPGSQFFAVNAMPAGSYPPQSGAYPPPPHHHAGQHPPSPHHPHHAGRPAHAPPHHPHHAQHPPHHQGSAGGAVYVRHGPPGSAPATSASYPVMYAQQPPRGGAPGAPPMGAVSASTATHASSVSKTSTHPSEKDGILSGGPGGGNGGEPSSLKSSHHEPMQSMEDMQAEREKEEMAMEQVLKSVKPIQTDYHLFIEEEIKKHRDEANKDAGDDAYLRNSSLNYRLKAAWETLEPSQRAIYLKREELDRKRFMEEEEIASRHCATLTARNSTPTTRKKAQSTAEVTVDDEEEEDDETRDDPSKRPRDKEEADQHESPVKKERIEQAETVEQV